MFAIHSRFVGLAQALTAVVSTAAAAEPPLPGPIPAAVERVIDGDTIAVRARIWLGQDVRVNVRLADVDAPELRRAGCAEERAKAEAARDRLVAALGDQGVALFDVRADKYGGRVVARVRTADGRDLSSIIADEGLAVALGEADWCPLTATRSR